MSFYYNVYKKLLQNGLILLPQKSSAADKPAGLILTLQNLLMKRTDPWSKHYLETTTQNEVGRGDMWRWTLW